MCVVCFEFSERRAADNVSDPHGDIAQLVERFHGMEEVPSSILGISTTPSSGLADNYTRVGLALGGVIAGEGCFMVTTKQPPFKDGDPRLRFVWREQLLDYWEHHARRPRSDRLAP
jgi:hypothetical protein